MTIVNNAVNDCAITVLDDAPIDPATGLPVPTIAVATDGGVSVIKDDGTVVDSLSPNVFSSIFFSSDYYLYALDTTFADDVRVFGDVADITADGFTDEAVYWEQTVNAVKLSDDVVTDVSEYPNGFAAAAQGVRPGLNTVYENRSSYTEGMVAYTTSTYNTGWMPGDIKGAFLSDTDDTDLVRTVENNVADYTADMTQTEDGWTINATSLVCDGVDSSEFIAIGNVNDGVGAVTNNDQVELSFDITAYTSGSLGVSFANGVVDGESYSSAGSYTVIGKITNNDAIYFNSTNFVGTIENVEVTKLDPDRSVNQNGLIVNGTVTRTAISDGADLVAYSGFSAANYLEQPYNSDLDFGTGDFCIMGWYYGGAVNGYFLDNRAIGSGGFAVGINSDSRLQFVTVNSAGSLTDVSGTDTVVSPTALTFFTALRRSGVCELYANGRLLRTQASTIDVNGTSPLIVGAFAYGGIATPWTGSLALLRISATAPTAEQIAKIYNDEKVLFQENAQATLYGTSDAVTALAHDPDTDLLHVGTSAGRSSFQGLQRVSNTTTAVTTAISASNDLIVEQ